MRYASVLALLATGLLATSMLAAAPRDPSPDQLLRSVPLRFEQDAQGRWTSHGAGYAYLFDRAATVLRAGDSAVRLSFDGANSEASFEASEAAAPVNYFVGRTFRSAQAFSRLSRKAVYPGIDVVFYGHGRQLEYDFNLAPGADPSRIRMRFEGAGEVSVNGRGEVVLKLGAGELTQQLPVVYQKRPSGEVVAVEAAYRIAPDGTIGLELGKYNRAEALVIDPAILYTAYLSGTYADAATSIAHDNNGYVYLGGYTYSSDFPAGGNVIQPFPPGSTSAPSLCWVMKLNPFASNPNNVIMYSTYFGGELSTSLGDLKVDPNTGLIYMGGITLTPDLPLTAGAFQGTIPNTNAVNMGFVAIIDPTQAGIAGLIYSSYFAGATSTNVIEGVATVKGLLYVVGWTDTDDLPMAGNSYQSTEAGGNDAFFAVFDPTQSGTASLIYSTYYGGTQEDVARSIAVDAAGVMYITGFTVSPDFPTTLNSVSTTYLGGEDAFIVKMDTGGNLLYSSYLGGSDLDIATKIFMEKSGRVAISGYTFSTDIPITPNAYQAINHGLGDAFIMDLDLSKTGLSAVTYSTYFGGSDTDVSYDIRVDGNGLYYIGGYTLSLDLPTSAGALNPVSDGGGLDGFVAVINPSKPLVYSSYITSPGYQFVYGVDYDAAGNVYVAGLAGSNIFPAGNANKVSGDANYDGFLLVFSPSQTAGGSARVGDRLGRPSVLRRLP
jgi:hypothetical protein